MGSSDLNMKKSWHPLTLANQQRIAEVKRKAEEEAQRTAKLQKELREERQIEEIARLNNSITHRETNQLDWMYKAPSAPGAQTSEDLESYLLGNRSFTDILKQKDNEAKQKEQSKWKGDLVSFSNPNANSTKDMVAKDFEDPLTQIKLREQAAIQSVINNPIALKKRTSGEKKEKKHKKKSYKHEHKQKEPDSVDHQGSEFRRSSSSHSKHRDRERRHKSSKRNRDRSSEPRDKHRRHRSRHRSRSPTPRKDH